jgi:hypothetical protein
MASSHPKLTAGAAVGHQPIRHEHGGSIEVKRLSRSAFNRKTNVDGAGYAGVAGEIRAGMERASAPAKRRRR